MEPNSIFIPVEWTTTKGVQYYLNKWKEESNTEDAEFEVIPPLMISENKNNEMKNLKVTKVDSESIEFENGTQLYSNHDQDCCENHYLSFSDLTLSDFEGLEFDLTNEYFFKRIDGYGIELIPIHGHSVKVPGYGSNNGYYSSNLVLILIGGGIKKEFDISDCQEING